MNKDNRVSQNSIQSISILYKGIKETKRRKRKTTKPQTTSKKKTKKPNIQRGKAKK